MVTSDPISDVVLRAWDAAERATWRHWRESVVPVDPVVIAERMGVTVVMEPLADGVDVELVRTAGGSTIRVDGTRPVRQVRRAVAHALGHDQDLADRGVAEAHVVDAPPAAAVPPEGLEVEDELYADAFGILLRVPDRIVNDLTAAGRSRGSIAAALAVSPSEFMGQVRMRHRASVARLAALSAARAAGTSAFPPPDWW